MKALPPRHCRGFTFTEVLLGIGLLAVLSALLLSAAQRTLGRSKETQCLAHLRSIGAAVAAYAGDHRMELPPGNADGQPWNNMTSVTSWLRIYAGGGSSEAARPLMRCPLDPTRSPTTDYRYYYSYSWNVEMLLAFIEGVPAHGRKPVKLWEAEQKLLFFDGYTHGEKPEIVAKYPPGATARLASLRVSNRHSGGVYGLLGSGSALWLSRENALHERWYVRPE